MSGRRPDAGHRCGHGLVLASSYRGHGNPCGARQDPVWDRRSRRPRPPQGRGAWSVSGRHATPAARTATGAVLPQTLSDTSAGAVRHAVQGPDTADRPPCPVSARVRWLGEPVAGSRTAGGMQPAPVDTTDPGGQAAAELAADIGHRRPGERTGLLEAEVVDLQPGHLAVTPAADDRPGHLVGVDAEPSPGVVGPGAQLPGSGRPQTPAHRLRVGGGR
jgi:hypothetical protein